MPLRETGEKLSDYVSRFVKSKRERKQFPKIEQRLAVAYSEARRKPKDRHA
jgi:hypothetical protein